MKNQYIKIYDIQYGIEGRGMCLPDIIYTDVPMGLFGDALTEMLEEKISTVTEMTCESYRFERMTLTTVLFSETLANMCSMILEFDPDEATVSFIESSKEIRKNFDTVWATWPGSKTNITDEAVDCFDHVLNILEQFKPEGSDGRALICLAHQITHMIDEDDAVWRNTTPITYRDLLSVLVNMNDSELNATVTLHVGDEFFSASGYKMTEGDDNSDIIEPGTFVLTNNR